MAKFLDLVERSVIMQSLLPILFGGASVVLWICGRAVPSELLQLTWVCVAFWMGAKTQSHLDGLEAKKTQLFTNEAKGKGA